jgi:class 3 adenylate cyclase/tetratricopeptide (TPR) repeat protein
MSEPRTDDGERKQVTVLFADVSGSMDLAEQQDPEEWRKIMQRFFSTLADAVTRFEGTVDKFTGDGIMAIFGAPVAQEDHAQRACYAALQMLEDVAEYAAELRRAAGLNFSTRIGIDSGEVVAGGIGSEGGGDYTAIGHTVGLAQRMEALAEPGRAYVTEHTAALARGFLDLTDLGEFEIKGASQPVGVFELAGIGQARSRLDLSREQGLTRFVGRDAEMAVLAETLEQAQGGAGGAIGIVAEPGLGKSRLTFEFVRRCREQGVEVFEAQAQAHGGSIPFMAVLQMLRSFFGIGDRDPEQLAREKIAGRALLLDPSFAEELPLLFDFLGVPDPDRPVPQMSPEGRQSALGGIVCRIVNAPARRKTLVLVVEDLHWIDEGSAAMLGDLIESVRGTNTLALVNYRPEYSPPWADAAGYRMLAPKPLSRADTGELLADLAGSDPSLDGIEEAIHERTQGNPFFIEEIVRELAESGHLAGERGSYRLERPIEDTGVPVTVQAVLAARIDRLEPPAKRLVQVASVVGREFSAQALGMAAGLEPGQVAPLVGELTDAGFLYEAEIYPERVLAFRHPLTREVAYGTQLGDQRAATHAAAARALVELNPDRHDELSPLIADHFEQGGEIREAARWSARAGYWAGHSRPRESLRLWRKVMELAAELDEDEESAALAVTSRLLQLQFAWRLGMDREEEERLASEAEEIARRRGDLRTLALLRVAVAVRPGVDRQVDAWLRAVAETYRLADQAGDLHLRAAVRAAGSWAFLIAGDFEAFEQALDEVLELTDGDPTVGAGIVLGCPLAWGLMGKGMLCEERAEYDRAEKFLDRALDVALAQDDPETASWIRGSQVGLLTFREDAEAALALARRNCELTERLGDVFSRTVALAYLCWAQLGAEEPEAALESIEAAERNYREAMGGGGEMEAWRGALRSQALRGVGRTAESIEVARWAAETSRRRGILWSLPISLLALGRGLIAEQRREEALDALAEGAEAARGIGALTALSDIEDEREALAASAA